MRKYFLIGAIAVLFALNFALTSYASFPENWDTYQPNVVSPGPWTFQTNNSTCYPALSGRTYNVGNPATPPNDYLFSNLGNFPGDCSRGTYGRVQGWFNASAQFIQVIAYVRLSNGSTAPSAGNERFFINSTAYAQGSNFIYSTLYSNQTDVSGITTTYKKFISNIPTTPGGNVSIQIGFIFPASASLPLGSAAMWEVDNVSINAGNRIIPKYNFEMYNTTTTQWFSIASFQGSRVILNYTGGGSNDSAQWSPNGVIIPDIKYLFGELTSSNLVTVWVGNSYSRTLIPNTRNGTAMWLDNPNMVQAYTVRIIAPPGYYGQNSKIWIYLPNHNITSGYVDSSASFGTYLVPGAYNVKLSDGLHTSIQTVNFPSTQSQITIDAYNISAVSPASQLSSIHWNVGWDTTLTHIIINYWDNSSTTTSLGVNIKVQNGTGVYSVFTQAYTVSSAYFQVSILATSTNLNKNLSSYMTVYLTINSTYFGVHYPISQTALALCQNCIFPKPVPSLPSSVGGLNLVFPNASWIGFFSGLALIFVGGGFGLFQSRIGFVILIFFSAFLSLAGWFIFPPLAIVTLAAMSVLGLLSWYRRN